jgi:hypothetical protein
MPSKRSTTGQIVNNRNGRVNPAKPAAQPPAPPVNETRSQPAPDDALRRSAAEGHLKDVQHRVRLWMLCNVRKHFASPSPATGLLVDRHYQALYALLPPALRDEHRACLAALVRTEPGPSPASLPAPPLNVPSDLVLTGADVTILRVLSGAGRALTYAAIVREAARLVRESGGGSARAVGLVTLGETTVSERVPILEGHGLLSRPRGAGGKPTSRKGVGITPRGAALVAG